MTAASAGPTSTADDRSDLVAMVEREDGAPHVLPGRPGSGALLVVDVQGSFADPSEIGRSGAATTHAVQAAVDQVGILVDAARAVGVDVVWVRTVDATPPWASLLWLYGREGREHEGSGVCVPGTSGAQWWRVEPAPKEHVVTKQRYSAFVGTQLETTLYERGITWVVVCGLTTECCVASTAFDAVQRDLRVVVAGDATAAYSAELHSGALRCLAENVGIVLPTTEIVRAWHEQPGADEDGGAPNGDAVRLPLEVSR